MQDSAVLLLDVQLSPVIKSTGGADVPTFKSPRALKSHHSLGITRQHKKKTRPRTLLFWLSPSKASFNCADGRKGKQKRL